MKKLYYSITTLEPLIITQHSDDPNMYETLQYIRGTVLQGVFAQHYLKGKTADDEFTRLIVSGDCVFSNAFPKENGKTFFPAPMALVREKYFLKKDENEEKKEKVHNLLVSNFIEQTKGISSLISVTNNEVTPLLIKKEIRLHNEINGKTRTTMEGKLFNYQSLPADMVFKGYVALKDNRDEEKIKKLIVSGDNIRMGRSTTSEYGKVQFEWINDTANEKPETNGNVIMTLLSDAIILNENGFSSPSVEDMNTYLSDSKIEKSISRKARIEGFLNVWKLRKPSENVFAAGSSFLLDKLPNNSEELINFGLGERTHEGYGQISFSLTGAELTNMLYVESEKVNLTLPEVIPELAKEIRDSIYFNRAKEHAINQAFIDADKTEPKITSNHLLGRLKDIAFSPKEFGDFLGVLRSTAKSHLEKSYLGNKNLVEHFKVVLSGEVILFKPTQSIELTKYQLDELKSLYIEQYLNQLRRMNINKEKDEKR
jgi:CRISPR-associated protein Csx10